MIQKGSILIDQIQPHRKAAAVRLRRSRDRLTGAVLVGQTLAASAFRLFLQAMAALGSRKFV